MLPDGVMIPDLTLTDDMKLLDVMLPGFYDVHGWCGIARLLAQKQMVFRYHSECRVEWMKYDLVID